MSAVIDLSRARLCRARAARARHLADLNESRGGKLANLLRAIARAYDADALRADDRTAA